MMQEFDLIALIQKKVAASSNDEVLLGIGDDAALVSVPADQQLVITMDMLNEGIHFPADTDPFSVGWKALAVNLSDLAAMGATPKWITLALALPHMDPHWAEHFLDGMLALARAHRVALIGGDTTRGALSVCVTAQGFRPQNVRMRRDSAQIDDDIWVTGTLGDAAAALALLQEKQSVDADLRLRLDRPAPRVSTGEQLRAYANACIDISDGLAQDLGHICSASRMGASIDIELLPTSAQLSACMEDQAQRIALQLSGGDDYELCFTARAQHREAIAMLQTENLLLTRIGRMTQGNAIEFTCKDQSYSLGKTGYQHFS